MKYINLLIFLLISLSLGAQEVKVVNIGDGTLVATSPASTETDGKITVTYNIHFNKDACYLYLKLKTYDDAILKSLKESDNNNDFVSVHFSDKTSILASLPTSTDEEYTYKLNLSDLKFFGEDLEEKKVEMDPITDFFLSAIMNDLSAIKVNSYIYYVKRPSKTLLKNMIDNGVKAIGNSEIYTPYINYMGGGSNAKALGEEFLAKNKTQPGVITTKSGLQYKVVKQGTGPRPTGKKPVTVNYVGRLISGRIFDSNDPSYPVDMDLKMVIKGFSEGLKLMNEGSKYIFYIPSNLGYGQAGNSGIIPPDCALIFEVELIKV